jgi:hypothetical protein
MIHEPYRSLIRTPAPREAAMLQSSTGSNKTDSPTIDSPKMFHEVALSRVRSQVGLAALVSLSCSFILFSLALPGVSRSQDWGSESDDAWSEPTATQNYGGSSPGWSLRAGIGFIDDPNAFLMNIEAPYAFDQWVFAGPMFQIGIDDNNTVVAPSLNVGVAIPDLPGEDFDRVRPYGFLGVGFAYLEDDNRRNDDSSAGFMVNFGFGLEYHFSEHVFLGSQMMFNFLPEKTLGQNFFYSWQVGGMRFAF